MKKDQLEQLRPSFYTITVDGKPMKLRMTLNAVDYLERTCGSLEQALSAKTAKEQKHLIRAFLLCNDPDNGLWLEQDRLDQLKPSLYDVGEWFDLDTIRALATELYRIAAEQLVPEGEHSLGESQDLTETAVAALGALSKLCGAANLERAWKIFGTQHRGRL